VNRRGRIAGLLVFAALAGLGVQRMRGGVPADSGFATGLPERVGSLELTYHNYTLALRPSGDHWVFVRGAKGRVADARVQEFLAPLRTLHGDDVANASEAVARDEEIALGSRRFEIRADAEDLDRRLIGIEVGTEIIDGRRAVRQQGRLTAFWADIWTDVAPLPFADPRWWLDPGQPVLCFDDPAVLQVSTGSETITLTRDPSSAGVAWWVGAAESLRQVEERHREVLERTAWSLTEVPEATVLTPPFDADLEAALGKPSLQVLYTPERAAPQEVAVGTLPSGDIVARSGTTTLLVTAGWRDALAHLTTLDEQAPTAPPPAPLAPGR